jgi:hypothetical protein
MSAFEKLLENLLLDLSQRASITTDSPSRWSSYEAPKPVAVVNVQSELDVATTVNLTTSMI